MYEYEYTHLHQDGSQWNKNIQAINSMQLPLLVYLAESSPVRGGLAAVHDPQPH